MTAAQRIDATPSVIRLFDKAAFSEQRFPRLQAIFERTVAASLENLREVCSVPPQYAFKDVQTEPLGVTLDSLTDGVVGVFSVEEWSSRLFLMVDRAFVSAITEGLFGSDGSEPPLQQTRPFSQIEKNIARAAMLSAAKALEASLTPVADLTVTLERIETDMEHLPPVDRKSQAVVARFELRSLGRSGELRVVFPQATIRSARAQKGTVAEGDAAESSLARQMQEEIKGTSVKLSAVLEERRMPLVEVAKLRVGQLVPLDARLDGRVRLICNGEPLFLCEIGQSEGAYTLRVDEVLGRPARIET